MDRRRRAVTRTLRLFLLSAALVSASPASAQDDEDRPWPRLYVTADGTFRAVYDPYAQRVTYEQFVEDATFTASYEVTRRPAFGGGVAYRFWRALGAGVTVTQLRTRAGASIEGDIPHPFFFDRPRHVAGRIEAAPRNEYAVHAQARVYIPVRPQFDVVLFGGPSRWRVDQPVLESVAYEHTYPYDTAEFRGAELTQRTVQAWGYNGGVDVGAYFSHHLGVGAVIEIATARLPLTRPDGSSIDANVGGLRFGAGVRLRFK
jgi:hypothetical protein